MHYGNEPMRQAKKSRVSGVLSDTRRLELVIVSATMLVLLIYSRPPRSGNAEVRPEGMEMTDEMSSQSNDASSPVVPADARTPMQELLRTARPEPVPSDPPLPRKRMAMVDARNTGNPKYARIMYGEVTVRWLWDGAQNVPKKVCIVDEGNGVTSIWSFDDHDENVIIREQ
jgi:hypothetical protein